MKKNKDEKQKGLLSALRYAVNRAFRYAWFLLIPMILVTILNSFLPAISGYISRDITNSLTDGLTAGIFSDAAVQHIVWMIVLLLLARVLPSVVGSLNGRLNTLYEQEIEYRMTMEVLPQIDKLSTLAYHNEEFRNKRHIYDSNGKINELTMQLLSVASQIGSIAAATAVCLSISPWMIILPIAIIPYTILSIKFTHDYMDRIFGLMKYWNMSSALSCVFSNTNTISEMKIFGGNRPISKKLDDIAEAEGRTNAELEKLYSGFLPMIPVIFVKTVQMLAYIWITYLIFIGEGTVGDFVLFTSVSYIFSGYSVLGNAFKQIAVTLSETKWFKDFVYHNEWLETAPAEPRELGEIESIRFENVTFKYPSREEAALENLDIEFHTGEYVALVGLNGAGKSTLIKLMCGLYTPDSGTIYYNGIPHNQLNPTDIRQHMTMISQNYFKYGISFEDNVVFGNQEKGKFRSLAEQLNFCEITGGDEEKYHRYMLSQYNDNALELSEGQWQRLAVARGLNKSEASVLFMDEPSSALDAYSEDMLFDCVKKDHSFGIKFVVTHRLACVKDISRIVVLENGRIIEDGSHTDLIREGGLYAELFTTQAGKYDG